MEEAWREIAGFPNYSVSDQGRIANNQTDRILKPSIVHGFEVVPLRRENRPVNHYVHRVVAEAYLGEPVEGLKVKFLDGDKRNPVAANLEIDTTRTVMRTRSGSRVKILETEEIFDSIWACANHLGGNPSGIYAVLNGRSWSYLGYHFRYVK